MEIKSNGYNSWNIYDGEKQIGKIETFMGFRRNVKSVYVNDKKISEIKNQKEAIEKLNEFFAMNKKEIESIEKFIEQLSIGMKQVEHQICIDTLKEKRSKLILELEKLKSYDLI